MELVEADVTEECVCRDVPFDEFQRYLETAQEMIKLCAAKGGSGLSAPQVGIYVNMFVWIINDRDFQIVINPKFYPSGKKKTKTIEGCLSYPGQEYYMERCKYIRAVFYTPSLVYMPSETVVLKKITKEFRPPLSIIFQHEIYHLRGKTVAVVGELLSDDKHVGVAFKEPEEKNEENKLEKERIED